MVHHAELMRLAKKAKKEAEREAIGVPPATDNNNPALTKRKGGRKPKNYDQAQDTGTEPETSDNPTSTESPPPPLYGQAKTTKEVNEKHAKDPNWKNGKWHEPDNFLLITREGPRGGLQRGGGPAVCEICDKTFQGMSPIQGKLQHMIHVHFKDRMYPDLVDTVAPFHCPIDGCSYDATTRQRWIMHYGTVHNFVGKYLKEFFDRNPVQKAKYNKNVKEPEKSSKPKDKITDFYPPTKPEVKPDFLQSTKPEVKPDFLQSTKPDVKPDFFQSTKPEVKPDFFQSTKPEVKPDFFQSTKPEVRTDFFPSTKPELRTDFFPSIRPDVKTNFFPSIKPEIKTDVMSEINRNSPFDFSKFDFKKDLTSKPIVSFPTKDVNKNLKFNKPKVPEKSKVMDAEEKKVYDRLLSECDFLLPKAEREKKIHDAIEKDVDERLMDELDFLKENPETDKDKTATTKDDYESNDKVDAKELCKLILISIIDEVPIKAIHSPGEKRPFDYGGEWDTNSAKKLALDTSLPLSGSFSTPMQLDPFNSTPDMGKFQASSTPYEQSYLNSQFDRNKYFPKQLYFDSSNDNDEPTQTSSTIALLEKNIAMFDEASKKVTLRNEFEENVIKNIDDVSKLTTAHKDGEGGNMFPSMDPRDGGKPHPNLFLGQGSSNMGSFSSFMALQNATDPRAQFPPPPPPGFQSDPMQFMQNGPNGPQQFRSVYPINNSQPPPFGQPPPMINQQQQHPFQDGPGNEYPPNMQPPNMQSNNMQPPNPPNAPTPPPPTSGRGRKALGRKDEKICEICLKEFKGTTPATSRIAHMVSKHFREKLLRDLKCESAPFTCPIENCTFSGKTKDAWMRHYGPVHNLFPRYLDEFFQENPDKVHQRDINNRPMSTGGENPNNQQPDGNQQAMEQRQAEEAFRHQQQQQMLNNDHMRQMNAPPNFNPMEQAGPPNFMSPQHPMSGHGMQMDQPPQRPDFMQQPNNPGFNFGPGDSNHLPNIDPEFDTFRNPALEKSKNNILDFLKKLDNTNLTEPLASEKEPPPIRQMDNCEQESANNVGMIKNFLMNKMQGGPGEQISDPMIQHAMRQNADNSEAPSFIQKVHSKIKEMRNMDNFPGQIDLGPFQNGLFFPCPHCPLAVGKLENLEMHIRTGHKRLRNMIQNNQNKPIDPNKPTLGPNDRYACGKCPFQTLEKEILDWHVQEASHEVQQPMGDPNHVQSPNIMKSSGVVTQISGNIEDSIRTEELDQETNELLSKVDGLEKKEGYFYCDFENCPYKGRERHILKTHIKAVHRGIKDQFCLHCDYKTSYKHSLIAHIKSKHQNPNNKQNSNPDIPVPNLPPNGPPNMPGNENFYARFQMEQQRQQMEQQQRHHMEQQQRHHMEQQQRHHMEQQQRNQMEQQRHQMEQQRQQMMNNQINMDQQHQMMNAQMKLEQQRQMLNNKMNINAFPHDLLKNKSMGPPGTPSNSTDQTRPPVGAQQNRITDINCPECNYKIPYVNHQSLELHLREAHFYCPEYNYKLEAMNRLSLNLRLKSADPDFPNRELACPHCDYQTTFVQSMELHRRAVHPMSSLDPFAGNPNNQNNQQRTNQQSNMTKTGVHGNTKTTGFFCDECPFTTAYTQNLDRHMVKLHGRPTTMNKRPPKAGNMPDGNNTPPPISISRFPPQDVMNKDVSPGNTPAFGNSEVLQSDIKEKCPHCPFETSFKQNLRLHIKALHEKVNDFHCDKCGFKSSYNLNNVHHCGSQVDNNPDIKTNESQFTEPVEPSIDSRETPADYSENIVKPITNESITQIENDEFIMNLSTQVFEPNKQAEDIITTEELPTESRSDTPRDLLNLPEPMTEPELKLPNEEKYLPNVDSSAVVVDTVPKEGDDQTSNLTDESHMQVQIDTQSNVDIDTNSNVLDQHSLVSQESIECKEELVQHSSSNRTELESPDNKSENADELNANIKTLDSPQQIKEENEVVNPEVKHEIIESKENNEAGQVVNKEMKHEIISSTENNGAAQVGQQDEGIKNENDVTEEEKVNSTNPINTDSQTKSDFPSMNLPEGPSRKMSFNFSDTDSDTDSDDSFTLGLHRKEDMDGSIEHMNPHFKKTAITDINRDGENMVVSKHPLVDKQINVEANAEIDPSRVEKVATFDTFEQMGKLDERKIKEETVHMQQENNTPTIQDRTPNIVSIKRECENNSLVAMGSVDSMFPNLNDDKSNIKSEYTADPYSFDSVTNDASNLKNVVIASGMVEKVDVNSIPSLTKNDEHESSSFNQMSKIEHDNISTNRNENSDTLNISLDNPQNKSWFQNCENFLSTLDSTKTQKTDQNQQLSMPSRSENQQAPFMIREESNIQHEKFKESHKMEHSLLPPPDLDKIPPPIMKDNHPFNNSLLPPPDLHKMPHSLIKDNNIGNSLLPPPELHKITPGLRQENQQIGNSLLPPPELHKMIPPFNSLLSTGPVPPQTIQPSSTGIIHGDGMKDPDIDLRQNPNGKYSCPFTDVCKFENPLRNIMVTHIKAIHNKVKEHSCPQANCPFETAYAQSLKIHMEKWHPGVPYQKGSVQNIQMPPNLSMQGPPTSTSIDGAPTNGRPPMMLGQPPLAQNDNASINSLNSSNSPLFSNEAKNKERKMLNCGQCDYQVLSSRRHDLDRHTNAMHNTLQTCSNCDFRTMQKLEMKKHKEEVHHITKKEFSCQHCNFQSPHKWDLQKHLREVHNQIDPRKELSLLNQMNSMPERGQLTPQIPGRPPQQEMTPAEMLKVQLRQRELMGGGIRPPNIPNPHLTPSQIKQMEMVQEEMRQRQQGLLPNLLPPGIRPPGPVNDPKTQQIRPQMLHPGLRLPGNLDIRPGGMRLPNMGQLSPNMRHPLGMPQMRNFDPRQMGSRPGLISNDIARMQVPNNLMRPQMPFTDMQRPNLNNPNIANPRLNQPTHPGIRQFEIERLGARPPNVQAMSQQRLPLIPGIPSDHPGLRQPNPYLNIPPNAQPPQQQQGIDNITDKDSTKCKQCNYQAPNRNDLRNHIKDTHESKVYPCETCPFRANRRDILRNHIKAIHQQVKDVVCTECGYKTINNSQLNRHMKMTHGKQ